MVSLCVEGSVLGSRLRAEALDPFGYHWAMCLEVDLLPSMNLKCSVKTVVLMMSRMDRVRMGRRMMGRLSIGEILGGAVLDDVMMSIVKYDVGGLGRC